MIREYKTKKDCARLWVGDVFNNVDSTLITELDYWDDHWEFKGESYDDEFVEDDGLSWVDVPMWNTWFEISDAFYQDWIERHLTEVAAIGFTLIYHDGELWGLGVDGAGYSFYDEHWIPLYDLAGIRWHEIAA